MRDNLPNMLRSAAKEWREENKVVATGATRYDFALEEAAEAIETMTLIIDGLNETIKMYANDTLSEPPKEEAT